ncbi:MAG: hypothetical protein ACRD32_00455 [Nitrososphaerales archaeon]
MNHIIPLALICSLIAPLANSAEFLPSQHPYGTIVSYLHTAGAPEPITFFDPLESPYFNIEAQPYVSQTPDTWGSGYPLFYITLVNSAGPFATQRGGGSQQVTDSFFRDRLEQASTEIGTLTNVIEVKPVH